MNELGKFHPCGSIRGKRAFLSKFVLVWIFICLILPFTLPLMSEGTSAARYVAPGWEVVEIGMPRATNRYLSMGMSADDVLNLCYVAYCPGALEDRWELVHADDRGGAWRYEEVADGYFERSNMALGPDGKVHIAAIRDNDALYFHESGGGWAMEEILPIYNYHPNANLGSMVIGPDGRVSIAFAVSDLKVISLVTREAGGVWQASHLYYDVEKKEYPVLASDDEGRSYIVYRSYADDPLNTNFFTMSINCLIFADEGSYGFNELDQYHRVLNPSWSYLEPEEPAITVDDDGTVHIAYCSRGQQPFSSSQVKYATIVNDTWSVEVVDNVHYSKDVSSMAIDSRGQVHLTYVNYTDGTLIYAVRGAEGWRKSVVTEWNDNDSCPRIVLDSEDRPIIGFIAEGNVHLARYSIDIPSQPADFRLESGDQYVRLRWSTPADDGGSAITGYRIFRSIDGGTMRPYLTVGPSARSITDSGLVNGAEYAYAIAAINERGESQWTDTLRATPSSGDDNALLAIVGACGAGGALIGALAGRALWK